MSAVTEGDISSWATAIHRLVQWVGNGRTLTTTVVVSEGCAILAG